MASITPSVSSSLTSSHLPKSAFSLFNPTLPCLLYHEVISYLELDEMRKLAQVNQRFFSIIHPAKEIPLSIRLQLARRTEISVIDLETYQFMDDVVDAIRKLTAQNWGRIAKYKKNSGTILQKMAKAVKSLKNFTINWHPYCWVTYEKLWEYYLPSILSILQRNPHLASLEIMTVPYVEDQHFIQMIPYCNRLENLKIWANNLTEKSLSLISEHCLHLKKLTILIFDSSKLRSLFPKCHDVVEVELPKSMTEDVLRELITRTPRLRKINALACAELRTENWIIEVARRCPDLEELKIHNFGLLTAQSISALDNCKKFQSLTFLHWTMDHYNFLIQTKLGKYSFIPTSTFTVPEQQLRNEWLHLNFQRV